MIHASCVTSHDVMFLTMRKILWLQRIEYKEGRYDPSKILFLYTPHMDIEKKCKSCGQFGHSRASSHKCSNYKPRPGKDPPPPRKEEGFWKAVTDKVFKTGFNSFFKSTQLRDKVDSLVEYCTAVAFEASRLLNYHVLRIAEEDGHVPDIDEAFVRSAFSLIGGKRKDKFYDENLLRSFLSYTVLRQGKPFPQKPSSFSSQVITILVNEYIVNMNNHIELQFFRLSRLWMLEHHVIKAMNDKSQKKALIDDILEIVTDKDPTSISEVEEMKSTLNTLKDAYTTQESRLKWIYLLNQFIETIPRRTCTLLPTYTYQAKYITIDTDVLHDLIDKKSNKRSFGENQIENWLKVSRIPRRYRPRDDNYYFNFMVKTDGVGCSVLLRKWIFIAAKSSEEKEKKSWTPPSYDTTSNVEYLINSASGETSKFFIGIDPGRKDVISYIDDFETKRSISNNEYYTRCRFRFRTQKMLTWAKKENLYEWERSFPSMSKGTVRAFETYLHFLFETDNHAKMVKFRTSRKVKKLRWTCHIHKQLAIDGICKELIGSYNKKKDIIVAFGDASFNHASKGYAPSPRRTLISNRLSRHHGIEVIPVREFNTSQVCSVCYSPQGLSKAPSTFHITKPHFVRRCSNPTCQIMWNRDVNAARNIRDLGKIQFLGWKRPLLYSKSLANYAHFMTSEQGVENTI